MAPPKLKFDGIQALLEHSAKKPKVLGKMLLINNLFLNIANKKEVYLLRVDACSIDKIRVYFNGRYDNRICFSLDNVLKLLKLLKSAFVKIWYPSHLSLNADQLLNLIKSTNGKRYLRISDKNQISTLNHVWQHLDEFCCRADLLALVETTREKPFDELKVYGILNNDELNAALRHPAKTLKLRLFGSLEDALNNEIHLSNNATNYCKLGFRSQVDDQMIQIVQKVCSACPQMKTLEIDYKHSAYDYMTTFEQLVEEFARCHQLFIGPAQLARALRPNLKINANFESYLSPIEFQLPDDWQTQLRNRIDSPDAVIEVSQNDQSYEKSVLKYNEINASFCYIFYH